MIKFENTEVIGWEAAIRGMRNPKNSHDRSDSYWGYNCNTCGEVERNGFCDPKEHNCIEYLGYEIGYNDHELMMALAEGGPVHAKYRRMITVYVDITAPLYWWKEFDTYKVGTVANSCSTMHKIHVKEFTLEDFSHEHLLIGSESILEKTIETLNYARDIYNHFEEYKQRGELHPSITDKKAVWWQMIQLLPSSYNQKRTVMLNYEVLAGIYPMRKDHKLDEWHDFCDWIKELPYSEIITGEID